MELLVLRLILIQALGRCLQISTELVTPRIVCVQLVSQYHELIIQVIDLSKFGLKSRNIAA